MGLRTGDIILDRYEIILLLGEGCAKVFLVEDIKDNLKTYALKVIHKKEFRKNTHLRKHLDNEVLLNLSLPNHPNIIKLFRQMEDLNYYYMLMEFITHV